MSELLSSVSGGSALPKINTSVAKTMGANGGSFIIGTTGSAFASLAAGQALTTVVNITSKSSFSMLFFDTNGAASSTIDKIKITINGVVWVDQAAVLIGLNESILAIGSILPSNTGFAGSAVIAPDAYEVDSIKIEIDTTTALSAIHVRAQTELIL